MKNKHKTIFWGFFSLDYKAMETYLEEMARKGWMLEKIGRFTAKFKAIEPKNLKFYVDVFTEGGPLTPENTREAEEYRSLCQESGWNFITSQDYLQFFYAEEGTDPVPIQTDQALEQKIVKSTLWKYELISLLISLIILIFVSLKIYPLRHTNFLTFMGVTFTFLYPILGIPLLFMTIYDLIWMLKTRKNIKRGLAIEKPTLRDARRRAMAFDIPICIVGFIVLIAIIADALFRPDIIVFSLLPPALGFTIGFGLRYIIKEKIRDKSDSIVYIALAFIIIIFIMQIISSLYLGRDVNYPNKEAVIPEGYPIITMYELDAGDKEGTLVSSEFTTRMSPITPMQYNYRETRDINGTWEVIRINYYKTINPYFAKIIFQGLADEMQRIVKWRNTTIRNKSIKTDEDMRNLWDMDNLVLTENKDELLIQKENTVVYLSGNIDFEKRATMEIIINRFFR